MLIMLCMLFIALLIFGASVIFDLAEHLSLQYSLPQKYERLFAVISTCLFGVILASMLTLYYEKANCGENHFQHESLILHSPTALNDVYESLIDENTDVSSVHILNEKGELTHMPPKSVVAGIDVLKESNGHSIAKIIELVPVSDKVIVARKENAFLPDEMVTTIKENIFHADMCGNITMDDPVSVDESKIDNDREIQIMKDMVK